MYVETGKAKKLIQRIRLSSGHYRTMRDLKRYGNHLICVNLPPTCVCKMANPIPHIPGMTKNKISWLLSGTQTLMTTRHATCKVNATSKSGIRWMYRTMIPLVTANKVLVTPKVIIVYPTHDTPNTQLVYAWKTTIKLNMSKTGILWHVILDVVFVQTFCGQYNISVIHTARAVGDLISSIGRKLDRSGKLGSDLHRGHFMIVSMLTSTPYDMSMNLFSHMVKIHVK